MSGQHIRLSFIQSHITFCKAQLLTPIFKRKKLDKTWFLKHWQPIILQNKQLNKRKTATVFLNNDITHKTHTDIMQLKVNAQKQPFLR